MKTVLFYVFLAMFLSSCAGGTWTGNPEDDEGLAKNTSPDDQLLISSFEADFSFEVCASQARLKGDGFVIPLLDGEPRVLRLNGSEVLIDGIGSAELDFSTSMLEIEVAAECEALGPASAIVKGDEGTQFIYQAATIELEYQGSRVNPTRGRDHLYTPQDFYAAIADLADTGNTVVELKESRGRARN